MHHWAGPTFFWDISSRQWHPLSKSRRWGRNRRHTYVLVILITDSQL